MTEGKVEEEVEVEVDEVDATVEVVEGVVDEVEGMMVVGDGRGGGRSESGRDHSRGGGD